MSRQLTRTSKQSAKDGDWGEIKSFVEVKPNSGTDLAQTIAAYLGERKIKMPKGTYEVANIIPIPSDDGFLEGVGDATVVKATAAIDAIFKNITSATLARTRMMHFKLDGDNMANTGVYLGSRIGRYIDLTLANFVEYGIRLTKGGSGENGNINRIVRCQMSHCVKAAAYCHGSSYDNWYINNYVYGNAAKTDEAGIIPSSGDKIWLNHIDNVINSIKTIKGTLWICGNNLDNCGAGDCINIAYSVAVGDIATFLIEGNKLNVTDTYAGVRVIGVAGHLVDGVNLLGNRITSPATPNYAIIDYVNRFAANHNDIKAAMTLAQTNSTNVTEANF